MASTGFGFRVSKTLNDEEIWYKANRVAGIAFAIAGVIAVLGALFMEPAEALWPTLLVGGPLALASCASLLYLWRL